MSAVKRSMNDALRKALFHKFKIAVRNVSSVSNLFSLTGQLFLIEKPEYTLSSSVEDLEALYAKQSNKREAFKFSFKSNYGVL